MAVVNDIIEIYSDEENDNSKETINEILQKRPTNNIVNDPENENSRKNQQSNMLTEKPSLIVKQKYAIDATSEIRDTFSKFLNQCSQRDRSKDMEKIINKLKRRYEQLDPTYAQSREFADLLNEKRNCLMNNNSSVYVHIEVIEEEMRMRKRSKNSSQNMPCQPSTSKEEEQLNNNDQDAQTQRNEKLLSKLEEAMKKCEDKIKQLEEVAVNFEDDENSAYLKVDAYKNRFVELYTKWCNFNGQCIDAGRPYLRRKKFTLTGIKTVDATINSFINAKLKKTKKKSDDPLPTLFPDYEDIFQLIHKCNEQQNLGISVNRQKEIAKDAFAEIGKQLKLERQKEFLEIFSFVDEGVPDPAEENPELMKKLLENRALGNAKLNAIFEEHCQKQEDLAEQRKNGKISVDSANISEDDHTDDENDEQQWSDIENEHNDIMTISPKIANEKDSNVETITKKSQLTNESESPCDI